MNKISKVFNFVVGSVMFVAPLITYLLSLFNVDLNKFLNTTINIPVWLLIMLVSYSFIAVLLQAVSLLTLYLPNAPIKVFINPYGSKGVIENNVLKYGFYIHITNKSEDEIFIKDAVVFPTGNNDITHLENDVYLPNSMKKDVIDLKLPLNTKKFKLRFVLNNGKKFNGTYKIPF